MAFLGCQVLFVIRISIAKKGLSHSSESEKESIIRDVLGCCIDAKGRRVPDKNLKELTPPSLRCGWGTCPSIFQDEDGDYVLIGKVVSDAVLRQLPEGRIGADETVVKVPAALLKDLF